MGSETVDDSKNLIKELRYMHGLGWYGANGQAADALERLSAENTDLHTKLAEVEQARDEALALLNEKDAALNAARACDNDFARSVERGKHIITDQYLGQVIKENQQLKAMLAKVTEERDRARLERDTLEQNRGCWTGHACLACDGTGEGAGADDELRSCPKCGGTGETWESYEEQLKRAKADAAVLRHALDNVVRDFMPGPGSGCDSRGVEDSLVLGAAALANVITGADILASMEVMHAALEKLACLGNGSVPGNSVGNEIAKATLVEAKTAGDLCAVRARVAARHKETA